MRIQMRDGTKSKQRGEAQWTQGYEIREKQIDYRKEDPEERC